VIYKEDQIVRGSIDKKCDEKSNWPMDQTVVSRTQDWKILFQSLLKSNFDNIRNKNPRFSLRAYARRLGLSAGCTWDIVNNNPRWKVSAQRALSIVETLEVGKMDLKAQNQLLIALGGTPRLNPQKMDKVTQETLLEPGADIVLMSFDLPGLEQTDESIAKITGLSVNQVQHWVAKFKEAGLIAESNGRWVRTQVFLEADPQIDQGHSVKKYHEGHLELAKKALAMIPRESRHFSTLTFNSNPQKMKLIASKIEQLINEVNLVPDTEPDTHVYRIGVSLFPVNFPEVQ
jgi:hypothetical protein